MIFSPFLLLHTIAAVFFCTYELAKVCLSRCLPDGYTPVVHMVAASLGEVVCSATLSLSLSLSLFLPPPPPPSLPPSSLSQQVFFNGKISTNPNLLCSMEILIFVCAPSARGIFFFNENFRQLKFRHLALLVRN